MLVVRVEVDDGEGEKNNETAFCCSQSTSTAVTTDLDKSKRLLSHRCIKFTQPTSLPCREKNCHTNLLFLSRLDGFSSSHCSRGKCLGDRSASLLLLDFRWTEAPFEEILGTNGCTQAANTERAFAASGASVERISG